MTHPWTMLGSKPVNLSHRKQSWLQGGGRHNLGRVLPLDQRNNSVCCQSRAEGNALKHIFHQRNKLGKDIIVTVQELG